MNLNKLATAVAGKASLKVRKASPEIFLIAGVAGVIVSTVMACRASRKVDDILDTHKEKVEQIDGEAHAAEEYEQEYDRKKELAKTYIQTGTELFKLYAPAVTLGALSLSFIFQSHNILRKRNIALAAAYGTIEKGFKKYRDRVVEELGEDADRKFRFGTKEETIEITEKDKNGKEKTKKEKIEVVDAEFDETSQYARIFDEFSTKWDDDPEYNMMFLRSTQNYANDYLKAHGYLFLNQVYEWLGFQKTAAGQQVGWVYNPKHGDGDNFVDFGIRDIYRRAAAGNISDKMFVNGLEKSTILDFNVDGNIMDVAFK